MPRLPYEVEHDDGVHNTCAICGCNINAGSWPPVCRQTYRNCLTEWQIETEFNRFAQKDLKCKPK